MAGRDDPDMLTPDERQTSFIEFDTAALTRANLTARTDAYSKAVGGPWMLPNEARAFENRPCQLTAATSF